MPPAAIRMCEPSLGDAGNLERVAGVVAGLARDVVAGRGLRGDGDGAGRGVVVVDRAGGAELAPGAKTFHSVAKTKWLRSAEAVTSPGQKLAVDCRRSMTTGSRAHATRRARSVSGSPPGLSRRV